MTQKTPVLGGELGAAEAEYETLRQQERAAFEVLEEATAKWRQCHQPGLRGVALAGARAEAELLREEIPLLQERHLRLLTSMTSLDIKRSVLRRELATVEDNLRRIPVIEPGPRLSHDMIQQLKRQSEREYTRLTGGSYPWK